MKITNTEIYGLEKSVIASGYPMVKSNDFLMRVGMSDEEYDKHFKRACKLGRLSGGHNNFLKGIIVQFDLTYPQYLTPQLQRYNFIDIISSQSKMHTLTKSKDIGGNCNKHVWLLLVGMINERIEDYNTTNPKYRHKLFMEIISNLPMGYELTMAISTNYLQLLNIYNQRKNHRLEDWKVFTGWILQLNHFKELTGVGSDN